MPTSFHDRLRHPKIVVLMATFFVALMLSLIAFTPQTAFADTQVTKQVSTTPNTFIKIEASNIKSKNFAIYVGAPGYEKRWDRFYSAVTPFSLGNSYKVPDGQYTTSVRLVSFDNVSTSNLSSALSIRSLGGNESSIKSGNHYAVSGSVVGRTDTTATINGAGFGIYWDTYMRFSNWRMLYSEDPNFGSPNFGGDRVAYANGSAAGFSTTLTGLKPNTTYYYQSVASVETIRPGISGHLAQFDSFGEVRSFTTAAPTVQREVFTGDVANITTSDADVFQSTYKGFNLGEIKETGVRVWSNGDISTMKNNPSSNLNTPFDTKLTSLEPKTKYAYQAYVIINNNEMYTGNVKYFETPDPILPLEVITGDATNITVNSASIENNTYSNFNGHTISSVVNQYSTDPNFASSSIVSGDIAQNPYSTNLSNLAENTKYYYRAVVTSDKGTYYGATKEFTTLVREKPEVITGNITDLKTNSAVVVDNTYKNLGGNKIYWVTNQYSTSPTMSNYQIAYDPTIQSPYSTTLNYLAPNTTYYYRAAVYTDAGPDSGVVYGEIKSFTTPAPLKPEVVTGEATSIGLDSAVVAGNTYKNLDGNKIYWVTNQYSTSPDMSNYQISYDQTIQSPYSTALLYLTPDTTYYYRAVVYTDANVDSGVVYGEIKSFKTAAPATPKVITGNATNITLTSADIVDNKLESFDGHVIYLVTNQYSLSQDFNNAAVAVGYGPQNPFSTTLNNLQKNSEYYYRAVVYTNKGIYTGETKTFSTAQRVEPVVTTGTAGRITADSARVTLNKYENQGNYTITEVGVQTSTDPGFRRNVTWHDASSIMPTYAAELTDLTPITKYYYRAYVTTTEGEFYGEMKELTTGRL